MRIKLILAADPKDPMRKKNPFKPLSLSLLAGVAPEHDYELIDMLDANDIDYESEVDLVGISVRRSAEKMAFWIADKCKYIFSTACKYRSYNRRLGYNNKCS